MAVWGSVPYSHIPNDLRLNAEYYQPKYLELEARLANLECFPLDAVSEFIRSGPFGSNLLKTSYSEEGIVVLRPFNIKRATTEDDNLVYLPEETVVENKLRLYRSGDVVFARVGDIRCGVISDYGSPVTISPNIIVVRVKEERIDPHFLALYMNTTYGIMQIERSVKIVAQPTITVETVKSVLVPGIPLKVQRELGLLVRDSISAARQAANLYADAELQLMTEFGLGAIDLSHQLTYVSSFSDAITAIRLDAEYFQPKYYRVLDALRQTRYPIFRLGDLIGTIRNGYDEREYVEAGTPYVRVGDITSGKVHIDSAAKVGIHSEEVGKDIGLHAGDVLFTRKGSFGKAAVVREGQEHAIISSEIMLLRIKNEYQYSLLPDYLALFLNSVLGYLQVERHVHGVAFYSISQSALAQLEIALPPVAVQRNLAERVHESMRLENQANSLLHNAKQSLEATIREEARI